MIINIFKPENVLTTKEANKLKLKLELMCQRGNATMLKKNGKILSKN